MNVDQRIQQVDACIEQASVSIEGLSATELDLALQLCKHFELQLGTLVRRADAIRILDEGQTARERLQEAAQHLICR
jgi:hypothetical protein